MSKRFDRTLSLIGLERFEALRGKKVTVVGLGGVGGAAAEALMRSGIKSLTFVDGDVFEESNLNRQILCTAQTLGKNKAETAALRAREIDEDINAVSVPEYATEKNIMRIIDPAECDYCIDAIDDVKNKILLIKTCKERGVGIISAMGAGNRLDCDFAVRDVYETSNDPFARVMRRELRKIGVTSLDTVCATTAPLVTKSDAPASISAPPMAMGAILAGFVIKKLVDL